MAADGLDAYVAVRPEHMRYLGGFRLADGEEKVAGHSGKLVVGMDEVLVLADSRYTLQAAREAPQARVEAVTYDLPARWPELAALVGARRVGSRGGAREPRAVDGPAGGSPRRRARPGRRDGSRPTAR